jgi:hypothetical protein
MPPDQVGVHAGAEATMTCIKLAKRLAKDFLLYLGLVILVVALIPVAAGLALVARIAAPALLVGASVGVAASATVRGWLAAQLGGPSSW